MKNKTTISSKKFSLNRHDFVKAFIVALLGAVITALIQMGSHLQEILQTGAMPTKEQFIHIAIGALSAGGAYLVKNFLTGQKMISLIKMLVLVALITGMSSCKTYYALKEHSSFTVVRQPATPNDTIAVEGKVWGIGDMAQQLLPPHSKAAQAWRNVNKYCKVQITNAPISLNDTAGVRVTCHSLGSAIENLKKQR